MKRTTLFYLVIFSLLFSLAGLTIDENYTAEYRGDNVFPWNYKSVEVEFEMLIVDQ